MMWELIANPLAATGPGPFRTMAEIKDANRRAGHHFFDADAMRFFRSRIAAGPFHGRYFITSEQFVFRDRVDARRYAIRRARDDGSIETIGEVSRYASLAEAKRALKDIVS